MLVVKNPGLSHSERSDPQHPLEQICIEVGGVHTDGLDDNFVLPDYMDPVIELGAEYDVMNAAFGYLMNNYKDPARQVVCIKLLEAALQIVHNCVLSYTPPREKKTKSKKELVSEAINYLDQYFLCKYLLISSFYFL